MPFDQLQRREFITLLGGDRRCCTASAIDLAWIIHQT
jgi:hypothetical protein